MSDRRAGDGPEVWPPRWLLTRPIAHRGLHTEGVPENSLGSLQCAVDAGFPVEIDVRSTRDGVPVVFHDGSLARLAGVDALVEESLWSEVRKLHLCGTQERVPHLEEVVELVGGRVGLLIEIKGTSFLLAKAVETAIRGLGHWVAVQSFHVRTVAWFRHHAGGIARGQLACAFDTDPMAAWKKFLLSRYAFNAWSRPDFLGHRWQDFPARRLFGGRPRMPVLAWTVRSPAEEISARAYAANIIFEGYVPA